MMYKRDKHPSCDKVKDNTDIRSEKDVDLRMLLKRTMI